MRRYAPKFGWIGLLIGNSRIKNKSGNVQPNKRNNPVKYSYMYSRIFNFVLGSRCAGKTEYLNAAFNVFII